MKKAIDLQELINGKEEEKPIEFVEFYDNTTREWGECVMTPSEHEIIIRKGKDESGMDIFWAACRFDLFPCVYRGHYNSGKY